VIGRAST